MSTIAAWCFQCGLDYAADVAECVECGVPTVAHAPGTLDSVEADGGAQVAYELHGWNGPARVAVETDLHAAGIVHAWQGPTLLVRESDEDAVDEVIGAIDDRMATSLSDAVATEGGRVGFDLGVRNARLQAAVVARLAEEGIDNEVLDNGFLLVDSRDEDRVGDLIEEVQAELRGDGTFGPGVPGVNSHEVVEQMFLACDVLRRNPRDTRAQRQFVDAADVAAQLSLPFGYEAPMWRAVLGRAATLASLADVGADDEGIEREAAALREVLHPYV